MHIEPLLLDPLLLIHDVDENARIEDEAAEKHHHQIVAHLDGRICAAIRVGLIRPMEKAQGNIHRLLDWPAIDLIFET